LSPTFYARFAFTLVHFARNLSNGFAIRNPPLLIDREVELSVMPSCNNSLID